MIWVLEKLIIAGFAGFFGFQLYRAAFHGKCAFDNVGLSRAERPVGFWISVIGCVVCFVVSIALLFGLGRWH